MHYSKRFIAFGGIVAIFFDKNIIYLVLAASRSAVSRSESK